MLTQMLAKIILHRDLKEFPQALLQIDNTGKTLLGIDRLMIHQLSAQQLMQLFGADLTIALPKSYVLAILLKEEAKTRALMGEAEEADALYEKSLYLLVDTYMKSGEPIEPRHTQLAAEVLEKLPGRALPADLLSRLFRYHEMLGRFDKAEDALYELVSIDPQFGNEGLEFYRRLLKKSDEELDAGGLPRDEVVQGMSDLEKSGETNVRA